MASVNVGEDEFGAVATAARDAQRKGNAMAARTLDKLARKISASLSNSRSDVGASRLMGGGASRLTWEDVPSVIDGGGTA